MRPADQMAVGESGGEWGAWGRSLFSDLEAGEKGGTVSLGGKMMAFVLRWLGALHMEVL